MVDQALFSSDQTEYGTPDWVFDPIAQALGLDFDAASSHENHKLPNYATIDGTFVRHFTTPHKRGSENGLTTSWAGRRVWLNPPFGRAIGDWVKKVVFETRRDCPGALVLLPVRSDTQWFHSWVLPYAELILLQGRISFEGAKGSAPFPTLLASFGPKSAGRPVHSVDARAMADTFPAAWAKCARW